MMSLKNVGFICLLSLIDFCATFFYIENLADLVASKSNYAGALLLPFIFCSFINVVVVKLLAKRVGNDLSIFAIIIMPIMILIIAYIVFYWMLMNLQH